MTREQWLQERKKGVGASESASILGLNPWKTNERLWLEKTGRVEPEDIGDKPYVAYGNKAEPLLRSFFALDNPQYELTFDPYKIVRHPLKPYIFATPDGDLYEKMTGRRGGLEIKTTEIMRSSDWAKWSDGRIPEMYYIQCLHQMLATGWDFVILLAQIKFTVTKSGEIKKQTQQYLIERTDESVPDDLDMIETSVTHFWEYNVLQDMRPALILPAI